jgi:hypothetical protein
MAEDTEGIRHDGRTDHSTTESAARGISVGGGYRTRHLRRRGIPNQRSQPEENTEPEIPAGGRYRTRDPSRRTIPNQRSQPEGGTEQAISAGEGDGTRDFLLMRASPAANENDMNHENTRLMENKEACPGKPIK